MSNAIWLLYPRRERAWFLGNCADCVQLMYSQRLLTGHDICSKTLADNFVASVFPLLPLGFLSVAVWCCYDDNLAA